MILPPLILFSDNGRLSGGIRFANSVEMSILQETEGVAMCYNCGCQKPDDDMGNPKNITNKTFEEAAKASGKKSDEAKKNVMELLEKQQGAQR